jgi:ABC-type branched-subunit amino acid transport system substrate-binding protein
MVPGGVRFRALVAVVGVLASAACGQKAGIGGAETAVAPIPPPAATTVTTGAAPALPSATGPTATTPSGPARSARSGPAPIARDSSAPAVAGRAAVASPAPVTGPGSTPDPAQGSSRSARLANGEPPPSTAPADPHDQDGVSDKEIVIGVHAPLTGAAPLPEDSLDKAKDLYWKFIAERAGIFGRNVRIVFRDDQYNPSRALAVCREMVEQEHVFILVGVGTDQVVSCARYASQAGIPYFSMGGSEAAVAGLRTYFSISMSFPQQAPLVAQVVKKTGKTKVAVVVVNTPNYDDIFSSLQSSARDAGLSVVRADRIGKQASQSEVLAEANNLRISGAEAVLMLIPPVTFLNLAHAAQGQAYTPLWAGPGLSNGLNLVAEFGCPSIAGARFLSPFPELDVIDRFDPDYKVAYRKYNKGAEPDDLGVAVWGMEKTLHQFLQATGPGLSRTRLLAVVQSGQEFASGVFPPVRFGPGVRFGASQTHLLEADCANRRYRTVATFASAF